MILPSRALGLALALLITAATANEAMALSSERLITGTSSPLYVTAPEGDSRLFVVEQGGRIKIYDQNGTLVTTFLDIDSRVASGGERGLLGLAFSPTYDTDRLYYVNYTNNSGSTVIARYQTSDTNPNDGGVGTEEILLTISQPFSNHNGGRINFGPDDMLYIGMGDGGSGGDPGNRAQNTFTLLGKILRIDVSGGLGSGYTNPSDNPFSLGGGLPEIWDYGIRNPWGMDFDPLTGDFYFADVGQELWEEVNVEPAGFAGEGNYGWRLMEGMHCFNPPVNCNDGTLILPVHEYSSSSGGRCSVTGGIVYRGSIAEIDGQYFFADLCSNQIWSFEWDGGGGVTNLIERTNELTPDQGTINSVVGICRDGLGEMYIVGGNEVFRVIDESVVVGEQVPSVAPQIQAAPNPFRTRTTFRFDVPSGTVAQVRILDLQGRFVRELVNGAVGNGAQWDGRDSANRPVGPGVYLVEMIVNGERTLSRVTVLR